MHYGAKKWGKIGEGDTDYHENLTDYFLGHTPPLQKISSKPVHNFLRYYAHRHITDRQTDIQNAMKTLSPCQR